MPFEWVDEKAEHEKEDFEENHEEVVYDEVIAVDKVVLKVGNIKVERMVILLLMPLKRIVRKVKNGIKVVSDDWVIYVKLVVAELLMD